MVDDVELALSDSQGVAAAGELVEQAIGPVDQHIHRLFEQPRLEVVCLEVVPQRRCDTDLAPLDGQLLFQLMCVGDVFLHLLDLGPLAGLDESHITIRRLGGGDAVLLQPGAQPFLRRRRGFGRHLDRLLENVQFLQERGGRLAQPDDELTPGLDRVVARKGWLFARYSISHGEKRVEQTGAPLV